MRDERNIQPLSDDYIKFIRFAHWKIAQAGKGILGFITNNSYLSGIIHRGMRKKLLETFDEIYTLNLHGSSRIGEKTPEGGKDENVFDIQQGVAIAIYVKLEKPPKEKGVYYADLWGLRREEKYPYLSNNDVKTTKWQRLKPALPYYFFIPKDFALQSEYERFWKVTEIFEKWSSGTQTKRDNFSINIDRIQLKSKIQMFGNLKLSDEHIEKGLKVRSTYEWDLKKGREAVSTEKIEPLIYPYGYRPFDQRWIYYSNAILARPFKDIMENFIRGENLGLCSKRSRYIKVQHFHHMFVSSFITDINFFGDQTFVFPLYLYPDQPKGQLFGKGMPEAERIPNFTAEFLGAIRESFGVETTPEEIFYYIYAILYAPAYRKRYQEFLKIDFPRVPLPSNYQFFRGLGDFGKELVNLHLLKHPALAETEIGFPKGGSNTMKRVKYEGKTQRVYINEDQYFDGIVREVWEYRIGAYQVMEKYLKDRKKRKLSLDEINHYMKVAKAIRLTINLQEKIEDIYKKIEI